MQNGTGRAQRKALGSPAKLARVVFLALYYTSFVGNRSNITRRTKMSNLSKKIQAPQSDLDQAKKVLSDNGGKIAPTVRALAALWGQNDRGRIGRALNIRYQWVRNVLVTPVTKKS